MHDNFSPAHTCPVAGCAIDVPFDQLMCGPHWRMVPRALMAAVYREWDRGVPRFGYAQARQAAIDAVNAQQARPARP